MKIKRQKLFLISIIIFSIITLIISSYYINNYFKNKESNKYYLEEVTEIRSQNNNAFNDFSQNIKLNTTWNYNDFLNNLIKHEELVQDTSIKISVNNREIDLYDNYTFASTGKVKIEVTLSKTYVYNKEKEVILNQKEFVINVTNK